MKAKIIIMICLLSAAISCSKRSEVPGISLFNYGSIPQTEIETVSGIRIYIDVADPQMVINPPKAEDILLITHSHHPDHYNSVFADSFPGKKLIAEEGKIETAGCKVTGIKAIHNTGDPYLAKGGTDYIFLIEADGVKIAHFGDIGQESFSDEQLSLLNGLDVALMQFENQYSGMPAGSDKGYNLIKQIQPKIIIPTHVQDASIKKACAMWKPYYSSKNSVKITKNIIPETTSFLLMGYNGSIYSKEPNAQKWDN
ncbi:MAG TPA: MBL fold metallo-hydrolase [Spirochaetota bacterium]|nr:MBL fold metallo-hydrolase [Spirochaetota bacterium]HQE59004.1 MBL fold metallo-hydrolase [Spirochaetota bacterium]